MSFSRLSELLVHLADDNDEEHELSLECDADCNLLCHLTHIHKFTRQYRHIIPMEIHPNLLNRFRTQRRQTQIH